jgi:hypothetical protein
VLSKGEIDAMIRASYPILAARTTPPAYLKLLDMRELLHGVCECSKTPSNFCFWRVVLFSDGRAALRRRAIRKHLDNPLKYAKSQRWHVRSNDRAMTARAFFIQAPFSNECCLGVPSRCTHRRNFDPHTMS